MKKATVYHFEDLMLARSFMKWTVNPFVGLKINYNPATSKAFKGILLSAFSLWNSKLEISWKWKKCDFLKAALHIRMRQKMKEIKHKGT